MMRTAGDEENHGRQGKYRQNRCLVFHRDRPVRGLFERTRNKMPLLADADPFFGSPDILVKVGGKHARRDQCRVS